MLKIQYSMVIREVETNILSNCTISVCLQIFFVTRKQGRIIHTHLISFYVIFTVQPQNHAHKANLRNSIK